VQETYNMVGIILLQ